MVIPLFLVPGSELQPLSPMLIPYLGRATSLYPIQLNGLLRRGSPISHTKTAIEQSSPDQEPPGPPRSYNTNRTQVT